MPEPTLNDAPVFSLEAISFPFGKQVAVSCDALEIHAGECVAFTGTNGSGKTTLLKLMNGLLGPFEGTLLFCGAPLSRARDLRRRSVFLHQQPVLFTGTVRDNLAFALKLRGMAADTVAARVLATARDLGIEALLKRSARGLSTGETQRVALGRALALGADVLLLDEPTAAMDAASQTALREILFGLKTEGKTLVVSTHDERLVTKLADRRVVFSPERNAAEVSKAGVEQ